MSKPSMFSKDYKKELKNRRRKICLMIIVPIVGLTIFLITDFDALSNKGLSMKKSISSMILKKSKDKDIDAVKVQKKQEEVVKPQATTEKPKVSQEESVIKNEIFGVSLSDGQKIGIEFNISGTEKNIKGVTDAKNISYDISPSKKSIVIQSKINQDMICIDVNKIVKDITKKVHKTSRGETILKDELLKNHQDYLWSITPKFIDEDNIAYVSELPWISEKKIQYIWKVNLKNNTHMQVKPAYGKNITFENITSKGLETIIDGNIVYVNSIGKATK